MIDQNTWSNRIVRSLCLIVLVTGALLMASPALGSLESILASLVVDDSFYYLLPAFNVTHGLGITFDGVNATNGFQPLWMLTLLPVALLSNNRELFLRMTIVYQAVIYALAVWLIVRLALQTGKALTALLTVVIWMAFGLRYDLAMSLTTNGLESALYFLMLALGLVVTLRASQRCPTRICVLHSTIMALIVLTRLDSVLIAGSLVLFVAWRKAQRTGLRTAWRELLPGWGICLAIMSVYVGWSMHTFGIPVPVSGMIKIWHSQSQAAQQFGGMTTPAFANHVVQVFSSSLALIASQLTGIVLSPDASRSLRMRLLSTAAHPGSIILITSLIVVGSVILVITARRFWSMRALHWYTAMGIMALGTLAHLVLHSTLMWPYALYNVWHYVGQLFVALVLVTWLTSTWIRMIGRYSRVGAGVALGLWLFIVLRAQTEVVQQRIETLLQPPSLPANERAGLYRASLWTEHLPPGTRLGGFNAGITGYFTPHSVTNLDGLINSPIIYHQMKNGIPLDGYITRKGIDYLIDYAPEGAWPMPELGGVHYLDVYAEQSASFVMDTRALDPARGVVDNGPPAAWLVTVRNRTGGLEWWVGTVWDTALAEPTHWRITTGQERVIAGPFDIEGAWLPEVPRPPRACKIIYDYRPLPLDGYGRDISFETSTSGDNWVSWRTISVPLNPDASPSRH